MKRTEAYACTKMNAAMSQSLTARRNDIRFSKQRQPADGRVLNIVFLTAWLTYKFEEKSDLVTRDFQKLKGSFFSSSFCFEYNATLF